MNILPMWAATTCLLTVAAMMPPTCVAVQDATEGQQFAKIGLFLEMLTQPEAPSVQRFEEIFGPNNEAEVAVIVRQEFPWWDRPATLGDHADDARASAIAYINERINNPTKYRSRFLSCLKKLYPNLVGPRRWAVVYPPERTEHYRRFHASSAGVVLVFKFPDDEEWVEDVVLPSGGSVRSVVNECPVASGADGQ